MKGLKNRIIEFLAVVTGTPEQRFNQALLLLLETPSKASLRFYNQAGYSKDRLEAICHDLRNAAGVTELEIANYVAPVEAEIIEDIEVEEPPVIELTEGLKAAQADLQDEGVETKEGFKLIILYPFLDNDDCPDEFKILVSDMMAAYRKYVAKHEELSILIYGDVDANIEPTPLTQEQYYALGGEVIELWKLNEDIHEELSYYAETGKILGKHPKLKALALQEKLQAMSDKKLSTRLKQVEKNLLNNGKKLTTAKDEKSKATIQARLDDYTEEKAAIEARLKELN